MTDRSAGFKKIFGRKDVVHRNAVNVRASRIPCGNQDKNQYLIIGRNPKNHLENKTKGISGAFLSMEPSPMFCQQ